MAPCGYEGTAVDDAFAHPWKALAQFLREPRTAGAMTPELPVPYVGSAPTPEAPPEIRIPVSAIGRR